MAITVQMRTEISQLYVALFGRAPDADGLGFWVGLRDAGQSLTQIANTMYATAPARAYFPLFLTNQEVIASFYVNVLGRTADAEGLAFWTAKLNAAGATPGSVITQMIGVVANYTGTDPAGLISQALFNNRVEVAQYYAEQGGNIANATAVLAGVTHDDATVAAAIAFIDNGPINDAGRVFNVAAETAAGADVMRLTGDQDVRIDFTNPANQVKGLDLNGDGVIANDGIENNVTGVASGYEIVDAYARNPLNEGDRVNNFLGDIAFDGTGFAGDGVNTDGNIFLGGLGADTAFGGIGNDFLAGGGVASTNSGQDKLNGGRNADFFYVELSPIDNADGNDVAIDGGVTADDTAAGSQQSTQDTDWLLLEASDDDEPVTVRLESSLTDENGDGNLNNDGSVVSRSGQTLGALKDVENLDASGNLYGFLDDMDIEIGGRRLDDRDGAGSENYGLGSSAQLNVIGSIERNTIIAGYDNDVVDGGDNDDIILGGNLQFLMETVAGGVTNPNLAGIHYDGVDVLMGGAGNDSFLLELDSGSVDGGDGNDYVFLTNYSIGRPEATEGASLDEVLADGKIRLDLGYSTYRGYRGDTLGEFPSLPEANDTSTSDHVVGTADQSNYNDGKSATTVTDIENVIATGLGQIDYLAAGTNDPELLFTNQQNFFATTADLELRGTDGFSDSVLITTGMTDAQVEAAYVQFLANNFFAPISDITLDDFTDMLEDGGVALNSRTSQVVITSGGNTLYASSGNDILEGRSGNDKLSGGAGNDDFVFELSNDTVTEQGYGEDEGTFTFDEGDGVDVIHRQIDANGDNIWDRDSAGNGLVGRDFGLNSTSAFGPSTLSVDFTAANLADANVWMSSFSVKIGGVTFAVSDLAALQAATTVTQIAALANTAFQAIDANVTVTAVGNTLTITDATATGGRDISDTQAEGYAVNTTVVAPGSSALGLPTFVAAGESVSQDRLIYKAYEDRTRNEGVDDDAVLGSSITLGENSYAQDLVISFGSDGTRIAEDQRYTITFADLITEDKVKITVNGVEYQLQVGLDLDGDLITNEDTVHNSQATVQANFLARLTAHINSFMDDDTAAGEIGASLSGSTLSLFQSAYNGEETVFINTPVVTLTNLSGGILPVAVVSNQSSHQVHLLDFNGRDGALNRENVLFVGEEFINRSILETAKNTGGTLNGSEAVVVDTDEATLAGIVENLAIDHLEGEDFSVHGDDLLIGGNGVDIIRGMTGDDRVHGSLGNDNLDGGKDYYAVQFLGEAEARVLQLNNWEAANPASAAAIMAVVATGKVFASLELIGQVESAHDLIDGHFQDTLIYQQSDFTPGVSRFTVTLDDFVVVGGVVQLQNGGAGHVGVDANGDGVIEAANVSVFTNFENIRTVSGTGAATAGNGQGNDTLNVSALSTATGGISYNLTNEGISGSPGAVRYSATGNPFIVNAVPANANTALGDFPVPADYDTDVMNVDGVENVIGGLGSDALFLDETEAAKNNRFEAGLGTDRVVYRNDFGSIPGEPTMTIKVGALASDTDTVTMTGGRIGATGATDTPTDTFVGVEYIALELNTASGDEENDVLDVTALVAGAVVDYTNGEVRTGVAPGVGVQVVIQNIVQIENVWADGNDRVIVADSSVMNNNNRSDELNGTPPEDLEFMTYLDYDQLNTGATTRKSFAAQVAADEITEVINQGQFTFSLSKVGTDADTDRVDYSAEDGRIAVVVGQGSATLPQFVLVDGDMDGDFDDADSRVDRLESVEEITAAQGESIMDFTTTGAARQITFQYVAPVPNPANGAVIEQKVRIADGTGNTVVGLNAFIEKYVYDTPGVNTGNDATWNRVEGGDAAEVVIYEGSENLLTQAGLDHRYSDDVLTLRGGANEVRYSPLETSIHATISVTEEDLTTAGVAEGLIEVDVTFQDGVNVGTTLANSGTHTITSYSSDNSTAAGSLKIEGSQDAEDSLSFTGLTDKVFILGTSPGVINVNIGTANTMVLTGFEYLQDAETDDVYDIKVLSNVLGNLTLVDNLTDDEDTLKVYNDAVGFGAAPADTIDLGVLNTAFNFDFDILDVTGVTSNDLILIGGGAQALATGVDSVNAAEPAGGTTTTAVLGDDPLVVNITPVGDSDWYQVNLIAGQTYTFTGTEGATLDDLYIELRSPASVPLVFATSDGAPTTASMTYTATVTGTHFLRAEDRITAPSTNSFSISMGLTTDAADDGGDNESVLVGNLDLIDDVQLFDAIQFTNASITSAGSTYTVDMDAGELLDGGSNLLFTFDGSLDTIDFSRVTSAVTVDVVDTAAVGVTLIGGTVGDTLTGGGGDDVIEGGTGADDLDGGLIPEVLETLTLQLTGAMATGGTAADYIEISDSALNYVRFHQDGSITSSGLLAAAAGTTGIGAASSADAVGQVMETYSAAIATELTAFDIASVEYDTVGNDLVVTYASGENPTFTDLALDEVDGSLAGDSSLEGDNFPIVGGLVFSQGDQWTAAGESADTFVFGLGDSTEANMDEIFNFSIGGAVDDLIDVTSMPAISGHSNEYFYGGLFANYAAIRTAAITSIAGDDFPFAGSDGTDTYIFIDNDHDSNWEVATDTVIKLVGIDDVEAAGIDLANNFVAW